MKHYRERAAGRTDRRKRRVYRDIACVADDLIPALKQLAASDRLAFAKTPGGWCPPLDPGEHPLHTHKWGPWTDDPAGVVRACSCGAIESRPEG